MEETPSYEAAATGADRVDPALVRLSLVLLVGAIAALLNTTIVAVALPELGRALDAPVASVHWVITAHLLATAAAIPTMGWLVDRFGARPVWLGSLLVFLIGTAMCAAAWSLASLVAFRILQGLGAGLVLPLVQSILAVAAGPGRVGRVMAMVGIPGQLAPILGPTIGALVVSSIGWRWAFLVLLPVTGLALVLAWRTLPATKLEHATRLDAIGFVLAVPGVVAVLYGLSELSRGKGPVAAAVLAVGLGAVAAFLLHARRSGEHALVDVGLMRVRSFRSAATLMFLFGFSLFGPMLLLPVYVEQVRGANAGTAGLLLALQGAGTAVGLALAGRWTDRSGPRIVAVAGHIGTAIAMAGIAAAGQNAPLWLVAVTVVLFGAGLGTAGVAVSGAGYRDLPAAKIPRATSLLNVLQRVGAAAGTAAVAAVLAQGVTGGLWPVVQLAFCATAVAALAGLVPARTIPSGRASRSPA